ncbi:uncharacterized protein METZ01_LOCUS160785, partial [marine metagenome]
TRPPPSKPRPRPSSACRRAATFPRMKPGLSTRPSSTLRRRSRPSAVSAV